MLRNLILLSSFSFIFLKNSFHFCPFFPLLFSGCYHCFGLLVVTALLIETPSAVDSFFFIFYYCSHHRQFSIRTSWNWSIINYVSKFAHIKAHRHPYVWTSVKLVFCWVPVPCHSWVFTSPFTLPAGKLVCPFVGRLIDSHDSLPPNFCQLLYSCSWVKSIWPTQEWTPNAFALLSKLQKCRWIAAKKCCERL